jgi:hypothetical protein
MPQKRTLPAQRVVDEHHCGKNHGLRHLMNPIEIARAVEVMQ